jgi:hypothetical protein
MPVRRNKFVLVSVFMVGCAILAAVGAWWNWSLSSRFGRVAIPVGDGLTVYAVRESWGLSSEQLSLTRNPDGCTPADSANDYIFRNPSDNSVLYKATDHGLTLYDYPFNRIMSEPDHSWPFKVTVSRSKDPFYDEVRSDPAKYGATLTKIPLNETCWKNIFRRSNSLR